MARELGLCYYTEVMSYSLLIVDDDTDLRNFLRTELLDKGYTVAVAGDGMTTLKILEKITPDLIILDIELPDISGETLCLEIKKTHPEILIIFLTARDTTPNVIHGLDIGADDYITKPFVTGELLARVRVRLRQDHKTDESILTVDDLTLNRKTYEVSRGKKSFSLTPKEFKLLEYLIINKNHVLSREQILTTVWKYNYDIESRVVDMYIGTLRKKIDSGFKKKLIHSVRGFGYSLKDD